MRAPALLYEPVLASLAEGMSVAEIVKDFPTLDEEAVRAIIAFAAASAGEDLPVPPAGWARAGSALNRTFNSTPTPKPGSLE